MTPTEQKIEKFHSIVGADISYRFEKQITDAVMELAEMLEHRFLDNETKVDYATHVFAKVLDDLMDLLEHPSHLN